MKAPILCRDTLARIDAHDVAIAAFPQHRRPPYVPSEDEAETCAELVNAGLLRPIGRDVGIAPTVCVRGYEVTDLGRIHLQTSDAQPSTPEPVKRSRTSRVKELLEPLAKASIRKR